MSATAAAMIAPDEWLYPLREPVRPRPAATVLLLREAADGYQVLMTRRALTASFAPGAFVFPGGALDAADGSEAAIKLSRADPRQDADDRRHAVAAIREAFEELGILLATTAAAGDAFAPQRMIESMDRDAGSDFLGQIAARGLTLALDRIRWLAHWITDRDLARRFDTRFLVAMTPPGQTPVADDGEQFEPVWITPAEALRRHEAGTFELIFPTIRTLRWMARYRSARALFDACRPDLPLWTSCPRAGLLGGRIERFMEDESPFGELALASPDGQVRHALDWQHERPVALLAGLSRLTAPNPGRMTGPGTNTYLLGRRETGYVVIDPGPADAGHVERIVAATGGAVATILCTHSHSDHSPAAAMLKAATGATILGLPSADTARPASWFRPDRPLGDGEIIAAAAGLPLTAVFTPGHAANHVCFFQPRTRLLFSGDHVLNGSTTIVDPPDGDMADYLRSLDRLAALEPEFILPAHGHVLAPAGAAIARLIAHRLAREEKVRRAVRARPGGDLAALVVLAYDDAPAALHGIAQRSLAAHLDKLAADGEVVTDGGGWRPR